MLYVDFLLRKPQFSFLFDMEGILHIKHETEISLNILQTLKPIQKIKYVKSDSVFCKTFKERFLILF